MPFQPIDYMAVLQPFLEKPSFLPAEESLQVEMLEIAPETAAGTSGALTIEGAAKPRVQTDVLGASVVTHTIGLALTLRRFTNESSLQQAVGNFILRYIAWVNYEQCLRGTVLQNPRLPVFGNGQAESIAAFGGKKVGDTHTFGEAEYQIKLQIGYQTEIME